MEIRKICQWCGKPFIAQKTTTCYCSHQCSNLGYKERIRERKRQLKRSQELLQPRQAAEGQDLNPEKRNEPSCKNEVVQNLQKRSVQKSTSAQYKKSTEKTYFFGAFLLLCLLAISPKITNFKQ